MYAASSNFQTQNRYGFKSGRLLTCSSFCCKIFSSRVTCRLSFSLDFSVFSTMSRGSTSASVRYSSSRVCTTSHHWLFSSCLVHAVAETVALSRSAAKLPPRSVKHMSTQSTRSQLFVPQVFVKLACLGACTTMPVTNAMYIFYVSVI